MKVLAAIGTASVVIVIFGLLIVACMGCRYIIIDVGRAIVQP